MSNNADNKKELTEEEKELARSAGEELWEVYLKRSKNLPPDFDADKPGKDQEPLRKRSRSVGEELWEVHLKRSKGLPPDYDTDEPENHPAAIARRSQKNRRANASATKPKKPERCSERIAKVMHLRSRDVKKMVA